MKKYLFSLLLISIAYGMDNTPTAYKYLSSYLPLSFRSCQYYSYLFIQSCVEKMNKEEYETLKNHALPVAQETNQRMLNSISKYADNNEPTCKAIKDLQILLENALKDWPNDILFHPLLFLQYKKDPQQVILTAPKLPQPLPKKTNDRHKHSVKKQKLVQDGR